MFLAEQGLHCFAPAFSLVAECGNYSLVAVWRLLISVTSLVAEHEFSSCGSRAWFLLSCSVGSSRTGDRTRVPGISRQVLNYWTTRDVPGFTYSQSFRHKQNLTIGALLCLDSCNVFKVHPCCFSASFFPFYGE